MNRSRDSLLNDHIMKMQYSLTTKNAPPRKPEKTRQINIESTIDADIVLRKVIEDRASILALEGRSAANKAELLKAR
jgi:hypothetical protein